MTKQAKYCGMVYEGPAKAKYIGNLYKVGDNRYVIARPTAYGRPGQFDWESGEFSGKDFRRCGGLNLGYAREVHYIPASAA